MPCGSARGRPGGLGGVQACLLSPLFGGPANGMGPIWHLWEELGGSGGWHAESPGSLPLEMKQDRARATRSPHDRRRALWMCSLMGMETQLPQGLPICPGRTVTLAFWMFDSISIHFNHFIPFTKSLFWSLTLIPNRHVHRHFGGQVLKPPKKGTHREKSCMTELKHKQHYTNYAYAVLDLRFLLAGLDSQLTFSLWINMNYYTATTGQEFWLANG